MAAHGQHDITITLLSEEARAINDRYAVEARFGYHNGEDWMGCTVAGHSVEWCLEQGLREVFRDRPDFFSNQKML